MLTPKQAAEAHGAANDAVWDLMEWAQALDEKGTPMRPDLLANHIAKIRAADRVVILHDLNLERK